MQFYERIAELERKHANFAIATVVARRSPVSSHLGDRALIFADGRMEGFVGGSCSRDIVRRQAVRALRGGHPLLLQIRPDGDGDDDVAEAGTNAERIVIPMSCASEGAVDVYIEPRTPLRRLIVVGFTPVSEALARLASVLDYEVVRVVAEDEMRDVEAIPGARVLGLGTLGAYLEALDPLAREALIAIVASQGHYDEIALEALLAFPVAFAGLLASRRRAAIVVGVLEQQGVSAQRLASIHNPVGLDIGARSPGEVAVSILAEIVGVTPTVAERENASGTKANTARAIDPVCQMSVDVATARYRFDYDGATHVFCGARCRASFAADPAPYLTSPRSS